MREYLHRAQRADNGEWVFGNYWKRLFANVPNYFIRDIENNDNIQVTPQTIGQLLQRNDKQEPIFDGDICQGNFKDDIFLIGFDVKSGLPVYQRFFLPERVFGEKMVFDADAARFKKVIGNQWDNPEIIKEQENGE